MDPLKQWLNEQAYKAYAGIPTATPTVDSSTPIQTRLPDITLRENAYKNPIPVSKPGITPGAQGASLTGAYETPTPNPTIPRAELEDGKPLPPIGMEEDFGLYDLAAIPAQLLRKPVTELVKSGSKALSQRMKDVDAAALEEAAFYAKNKPKIDLPNENIEIKLYDPDDYVAVKRKLDLEGDIPIKQSMSQVEKMREDEHIKFNKNMLRKSKTIESGDIDPPLFVSDSDFLTMPIDKVPYIPLVKGVNEAKYIYAPGMNSPINIMLENIPGVTNPIEANHLAFFRQKSFMPKTKFGWDNSPEGLKLGKGGWTAPEENGGARMLPTVKNGVITTKPEPYDSWWARTRNGIAGEIYNFNNNWKVTLRYAHPDTATDFLDRIGYTAPKGYQESILEEPIEDMVNAAKDDLTIPKETKGQESILSPEQEANVKSYKSAQGNLTDEEYKSELHKLEREKRQADLDALIKKDAEEEMRKTIEGGNKFDVSPILQKSKNDLDLKYADAKKLLKKQDVAISDLLLTNKPSFTINKTLPRFVYAKGMPKPHQFNENHLSFFLKPSWEEGKPWGWSRANNWKSYIDKHGRIDYDVWYAKTHNGVTGTYHEGYIRGSGGVLNIRFGNADMADETAKLFGWEKPK